MNNNEQYILKSLDIAKQELIQADSKIGWTTAIFSIILSAMISLMVAFKLSLFMLIIIIPLSLSLLVLLYALYPKLSYTKDRNQFVSFSPTKIAQLDNHSSMAKVIDNERMIESATHSIYYFSKSARDKYILIKIAILITFPFMILFKR